ncbi:hypothetical protein VNO78_07698 [Psophocarpus tetragonolobus]|uniref:Late embryogenesis abundant protein LEA-2 subgroup domain-containing protein n=1 Tax=Psophocarpus tetragonolobus TaxID=3891 RepID=A0AAN9SVS8_PSOTE
MEKARPKWWTSPVAAYNITTEEVISMHPSRVEEKESNKCLVYALIVFVAILFVWLVFASTMLRMGDPEIELKSARLTHKHNVNNDSHSNVTMIAGVSLANPNLLGRFYYGNTTLSVLYGASSVGAWELEGSRLEARETKQIDFMLHMSFHNLKRNLTNNLKLTSYAKLSGTVHLLHMIKKTKTIHMACFINLNFTSYSTQHFQC